MVKEKEKLNKAEIKAILKPYNKDVKRHIGALKEHFEHNVQVIGEQYHDLKKDITGLKKDMAEVKNTQKSHTEMIGNLAVDVETLKGDMKVVKEDIVVLKDDMKVVKEDIKVMKEDIVVLKDDMIVVKSDLQIIKTDVEPRVAHLEASDGVQH